MSRRIDTISDVVACNLCTGCGACAGMFPNAIAMIEDDLHGLRPVIDSPGEAADREALAVCAGVGHAPAAPRDATEADWGPVLACWEGHAADAEIRFRGSSGGAVTALAAFALARGDVGGVAHVQADPQDATRNATRISRTRADLLRGAGSRYAQASVLDCLDDIAREPTRTAVIGKPCDIASLSKARNALPGLNDRVGLTIAIFCAGAPNRAATRHLLDRLNVPATAEVTDLRYRGNGWPGLMQARWRDADGQTHDSDAIPYAEGWGGILQAGRQWRCRICDDHTGAHADISVGDPWHNPPEGNTDAGRSLIVARSLAGKALVEAAIAAGALVAEPRDRDVIARAQPNLLATNAAVWGRRLAMRALGMPVPEASAASRFGIWRRRLSPREQAQSVLGSLRRILRARLHRRTA